MSDATFEEGAERPLRLRAESAEDLSVISTLLQDAVGQTGQIAWAPRRRRFTLLLNRFRWEDAPSARRQNRPFERVQTLLVIDSVLRARAMGLDSRTRDVVIAVIALAFDEGAEGAGILRLVLSGDGEIALAVECLDVLLADVTRPYEARAAASPHHALD